MKAFVYKRSRKSELDAVFNDVSCVQCLKDKDTVNIIDEYGEKHTYNKKEVKTCVYQN